jgi:transposase-like protein
MERAPKGRYSKEFREEAVKLITKKKMVVKEAVDGFSWDKEISPIFDFLGCNLILVYYF